MEEAPNPWKAAIETVRATYHEGSPEQRELEFQQTTNGCGSGYVVDCLRLAVMVQTHTEYAAIVKAAIALGHDTDTTAAVAGGIAGLRFGLDGIPAHWINQLRGRHLIMPLIEKLLSQL